jgi:hypothetical protein
LPELPNQLRVLALGIVRRLIPRDARSAVLAGESLWRASHGQTAPALTALVSQALQAWSSTAPRAAMDWWLATDRPAVSTLFRCG